ncbi:MAG: GtrA family protein [Clostridia bacterium]|jgi:putative flippase GtrA
MKRIWNEAALFSFVGLINTGVDFAVFSLLNGVVGIHHMLSQVLSYSCGIINSFFLNRRWTFRVKRPKSVKEFAAFVLVNILSLGVSLLLLYITRDFFQLNIYLSKGIATVFSMGVNFSGNKWMVFRQP